MFRDRERRLMAEENKKYRLNYAVDFSSFVFVLKSFSLCDNVIYDLLILTHCKLLRSKLLFGAKQSFPKCFMRYFIFPESCTSVHLYRTLPFCKT